MIRRRRRRSIVRPQKSSRYRQQKLKISSFVDAIAHYDILADSYQHRREVDGLRSPLHLLQRNQYEIFRHSSSITFHHRKISTMVRLHQASITAALIICSSTAPGQSTEEEKVCASASAECSTTVETIRLGLEWFTNPDHLPLIVAQKHGILASFGLDVQLIEPSDHWEAEEEILAGRLDVAVTEPLHLAQDAAKGKPVLGFSRFLHTDGGVLYDAGRGDIKRPADMCGKTISYPGR